MDVLVGRVQGYNAILFANKFHSISRKVYHFMESNSKQSKEEIEIV